MSRPVEACDETWIRDRAGVLAVIDPPPSRFESASVLCRGERARRRRLLLRSAGGAVTVAAACSAVLAAGSMLVGTPAPAPAPPAAVGAAPAQAVPRFTEPANHSYILTDVCSMVRDEGVEVVVVDHRVKQVTRVNADGRQDVVKAPTLRELLTRAETAIKDGSEATVEMDPTDGHPIAVTFNLSRRAFDGATCYEVSDYRAAGA